MEAGASSQVMSVSKNIQERFVRATRETRNLGLPSLATTHTNERKGHREQVEATAEVVWSSRSSPGPPGMGVRFVEVATGSESLRRFLEPR